MVSMTVCYGNQLIMHNAICVCGIVNTMHTGVSDHE